MGHSNQRKSWLAAPAAATISYTFHLTPHLTSQYNCTRTQHTFGGICLSEVRIGSHESFEQALRRFNKLVQQTGILAEARRREHYESPSVRRKKKAAAKRRKTARNAQRG